jgi:CDP-glycerol glycerophosphotransferase (TagB/SpsB family)
MINFIYPKGERTCYWKLLDLYVKNIVGDFKGFTIGNVCDPSAVNVHFFLEPEVLEACDMRDEDINIFIPHGIADKGYRNAYSVSRFSSVVVSGPMWKGKLMEQGLPENKIFIGGYPKIDNLFQEPRTRENIVWLPTHNFSKATADTLSSYPGLLEYEGKIARLGNLITSEHPANKDTNSPTDTELAKAFVVIADCGSTIYEALALDIPVVFPDWLVRAGILKHYGDTFEGIIYKQYIGYHADDIKELLGYIDQAKSSGPSFVAQQFMDGIFPRALRGCSGRTILDHIRRFE